MRQEYPRRISNQGEKLLGKMGLNWKELEPRLAEWGVFHDTSVGCVELKEAEAGERVLITEREPKAFLVAFFTALKKGCAIFLASPDWKQGRFEYLLRLIRPHYIQGPRPFQVSHEVREMSGKRLEQPAVMVPTGGTTGEIRYTIHNWETLCVAARGFNSFHGGEPINACCMLPLYHVSGLMQVVRSLVSGGRIQFLDYHSILRCKFPEISPKGQFISLVPTQLIRLMRDERILDWLRQFSCILLGGSPAREKLLQAARDAELPLSPCYGLTESGALVTMLESKDFLAGKIGVGRSLPHAQVLIREPTGLPARPGTIGRIIIKSDALFQGYYPEVTEFSEGGFATEDEGFFDENGFLHIVRRLDKVINTGGEKVNPDYVEKVLMETGQFSEVLVTGAPDSEWGEQVVAIYVPRVGLEKPVQSVVWNAMGLNLSAHEIPKQWIKLSEIPVNSLGKPDIDEILKDGGCHG